MKNMGGKPLFFIKLAPFNDCIAEYQLLDMRYVGSKWSWHKGSVGPGRILGRLDKVLCNHLWIDLMEEFFYEYYSSASSDHAPMVLHQVVKITLDQNLSDISISGLNVKDIRRKS